AFGADGHDAARYRKARGRRCGSWGCLHSSRRDWRRGAYGEWLKENVASGTCEVLSDPRPYAMRTVDRGSVDLVVRGRGTSLARVGLGPGRVASGAGGGPLGVRVHVPPLVSPCLDGVFARSSGLRRALQRLARTRAVP